MPGSLRAFLDASVLYPVSLRHLLMRLTLARLFQARWSATVHEEWEETADSLVHRIEVGPIG